MSFKQIIFLWLFVQGILSFTYYLGYSSAKEKYDTSQPETSSIPGSAKRGVTW